MGRSDGGIVVLLCGSLVYISIQGGEESSLSWSVVESGYSPTSACKYSVLYIFLQPAAESLVLVDTRVANGGVVERPNMWFITERRLWPQNWT